MDLVTIMLISLVFSWTIFQGLASLSRSSKKFPPGPTPLPLIGNLHLLGDLPHKSLAKLAKTYGPIMSLKLGQITTIVISSPTVAKEVLQNQDLAFSNRFVTDAVRAHDHFKYSVAFLSADSRWRSLRRIMKSSVFSNNRLDANQEIRFRKVNELIAYCTKISQTGDQAVDIGRAAFRTSLNLLSNTIFSKDITDPYSDSAKEFRILISNIMIEIGKPNLVDYFPVLQRFDPQGVRRRQTNNFGELLKLLDGLINEHLEQKKSQGVLENDVLDVLLATSEENPEEIDRPHIEHMCLDLFAAGTDTTSNTLEWAMTELLRNLETMKKVKEELAQVIGRGKPIREADVAKLPYLQCIIKETLRLHSLVPFLLPRRMEQDIELCGYTIPKGSQVLVNVWAIGRDSDLWENSLAFKPERFWNSEMDVRGRDFELLPFGSGRRICPGLPLAMRMVSVMLGSLLNNFDWKLEEVITPDQLDMEEKFGITLQRAQPLRAIPISL